MRREGQDVVTLSDDFAGIERKSHFRVTRRGQRGGFFAPGERKRITEASKKAEPRHSPANPGKTAQ